MFLYFILTDAFAVVDLDKLLISIASYLGIQFGEDLSTSHVAKNFIGTGLSGLRETEISRPSILLLP